MNKNGFVLLHALLGLLIVSLCVILLHTALTSLRQQKEIQIETKINEKWFYDD